MKKRPRVCHIFYVYPPGALHVHSQRHNIWLLSCSLWHFQHPEEACIIMVFPSGFHGKITQRDAWERVITLCIPRLPPKWLVNLILSKFLSLWVEARHLLPWLSGCPILKMLVRPCQCSLTTISIFIFSTFSPTDFYDEIYAPSLCSMRSAQELPCWGSTAEKRDCSVSEEHFLFQ